MRPKDRCRWSAQDRALGMHRAISRRDLLQGMAAGGAGLLASPLLGRPASARAGDDDANYPPLWTGMRGSNDGSFEAAHAARDGKTWDEVTTLGEEYDLVVVGAGISGLAAAHFYRARTSPSARILLLDNHDDFGGHARRNEFRLGGRTQLLNGGTLEIDSPRPYSAVADGLLRALGLDVEAMVRKHPGLDFWDQLAARRGVFLDRETFGADRLVVARDGRSWAHFLDGSPLSAQARADVLRIEEGRVDYLAGKSSAEKKDLLSRMSYLAFLRDVVRVEPQVLALYQAITHGWWGVGIDAVSALDVWGLRAGGATEGGGFLGLGLEPSATPRMGPTPAGYVATGGSYRLHFPDGNATIARLLVRSLVPAAAPAGSVEDLVLARFDYGALDLDRAPVRLRLRSTAVRVRQREAPGASVEVAYVREGRAYQVRARHCVLACWNMIIPTLCPELPEAQKAALHSLVKTPLVYTSVALRDARAFERAAVRLIYAPGSYHSSAFLNPAARIGTYRPPVSADQPTLLHLQRTPCKPGLPEKEQNRAGRRELLDTPFETFEREIRAQLGRMLSPYGLDPARDITAITVNRWPHGYAPEFNPLDEPELPEAQRPYVVGRARFGRIAIANSDAGGLAYTSSAIDQAHRAVQELLVDAA